MKNVGQFFYLLFGCPTDNFGSLWRGEINSLDVNHCYREPRNEVGSEHMMGFETGTSSFYRNVLTH